MKNKIIYVMMTSVFALGGCTGAKPTVDLQLRAPELRMYSSCAEIQKDAAESVLAYQKYQLFLQSQPSGNGIQPVMASGAAKQDALTERQEPGVDEADKVVASDNQIFYSRGDGLIVLRRDDQSLVGVIPLKTISHARLILSGDILYVVGQSTAIPGGTSTVSSTASVGGATSGASATNPGSGNSQSPIYYAPQTTVQAYSIKIGAMPTLNAEKNLSGTLVDLRALEGRLFVVMSQNEWASGGTAVSLSQKIDSKGTVHGVACNRISHPIVNDFDSSWTEVHSLKAQGSAFEENQIILSGAGDKIYGSAHNLYLIKSGISICGYGGCPALGNAQQQQMAQDLQDSSFVTKIHWDGATGALEPRALGIVPGHIKDSYSLSEIIQDKAELIAVATSSGQLWTEGQDAAKNHFVVLEELDGVFKIDGATENFGHGEDIRAVRFTPQMAYVVTFKKTDPLFAISMKDPRQPKLLGEVMVPGFSTYLKAVSPTRLFGLGFDALDEGNFAWFQGLQVSLFDVSNPENMSRVYNRVLGQRGSFSEASQDPHAVFYNESAQVVGIPLVEVSSQDLYTSQRVFSGARFFAIENDQLIERATLSHYDLVPEKCRNDMQNAWRFWSDSGQEYYDISRMIRLDGKVLTFSNFGTKSWTEVAGLPMDLSSSISYPIEQFDNPCLNQILPYSY